MELRVGGKYKFTKKLGNGAFGDIYSGVNIKTNEEVAIKLELLKSKFPQLQYEAKLYKVFEGGSGLSTVHYFGVEGDYNVMVMDILGPSLENLFQFCDRSFSYKTACMVIMQCITRIEFLHSRDFIHRDIKPENFLIGVAKKASIVYTIDFGLAKRYKDPKTGSHIAFKENKGMTGTARQSFVLYIIKLNQKFQVYASLNVHLGYEQSRRDDLEAIGYMTSYFLRKGHLPWMGQKGKTKTEKYNNIRDSKANAGFEELLEGHPQEFVKYMKYCRELQFEQKPDYKSKELDFILGFSYLRKLFESYLQKNGYEDDYEYDWVIKKAQKLKELNPLSDQQQEEQKREQSNSPNKKLQGSTGLSAGLLSNIQKQKNQQSSTSPVRGKNGIPRLIPGMLGKQLINGKLPAQPQKDSIKIFTDMKRVVLGSTSVKDNKDPIPIDVLQQQEESASKSSARKNSARKAQENSKQDGKVEQPVEETDKQARDRKRKEALNEVLLKEDQSAIKSQKKKKD